MEKLSPKRGETSRRVAELAEQGYSQATIAGMIGVTRERVRQICKRDGIETLSGDVDWDLIDSMDAYARDGLSVTQTAERLGRQVCVIRHNIKYMVEKFAPPPVRAASGYRGVSLHKSSGLWRADIHRGGRQVCLGYSRTLEGAVALRHAAETEGAP